MIEPLTIRLSAVRLLTPVALIAAVLGASHLVLRAPQVWEVGAPIVLIALIVAAAAWATVRLEIDGEGVHVTSPQGRDSLRWAEMAAAQIAGAGARRQAALILTPAAHAARGGPNARGLGAWWSVGAEELCALLAQCIAAAAPGRGL